MTVSTALLETQTCYEDVLAHLPTSKTTEYHKGQLIYGMDTASVNIYLVLEGKVGLSHVTESGAEVILEIVRPEEVFGESAFLNTARRGERAKAIEASRLMAWAASDIETMVTKRPRLAVALLQILAQRNAEYTRRIESFAVEGIERRLARSLLRFSDRLGTTEPSGSVSMRPFTHELLSQYVGTSREIVTQYMNSFRKRGYVTYSRHEIILYRDKLSQVLEGRGFVPAEATGARASAAHAG